MFENNNIIYFLIAIVPALLYSFVIYINMPFKSIKIKNAIKFLLIGLLSAVYTLSFNFIFPSWSKPIGADTMSIFLMAFIQVALIEELAKYITYKTSESFGHNKLLPVEIIFYSCMASMGFAIFENVYYLLRHYEELKPLLNTPFHSLADSSIVVLLKVRSVTAIVAHMITGIFMGYFIALGRQKITINNNSSPISIYFKRRTRLRKFAYSTVGVFVAIVFHGLYDLNLMLPENPYTKYNLFAIIAIGLIISYLMSRKLIRLTNIPRRKRFSRNNH